MLELHIVADTELRQRAIEAAEKFVKECVQNADAELSSWPVSRSQIAGLRQIATKEPGQIATYAEKQRERARARLERITNQEKRHELQAQINFWELIKGLCEGKGSKFSWSLAQMRDQALPAELREEKHPPGVALSKEQQAARKQKSEQRQQWLRRWEQEYYPAFFHQFCIHYIYEMVRRTGG
jgi:hypothetical protein